ncbi:MAG: YkgJ family cysteine cluster protein [Cyanobacteria bacterium P01_D01_bin.73]
MTLNPLERYQKIRDTITTIAESAEVLIGHLVAEGKREVAPEIAQMIAHTAVALTDDAVSQSEKSRTKSSPLRNGEKSSRAIACQSGCDCCCHLHVPASKPEIQLLLRHLRRSLTQKEQDDLRGRIEKTSQRITKVSHRDRLSRKIPCIFLKNGQCLVYPVRPAACRDHNSIDLSACEDSFNSGKWSAPSNDQHNLVANSATMAISQACTAFEFDCSFGELHAELLVALDPDATFDLHHSDPWHTPEDLDDAMLPTVLWEAPQSEPETAISNLPSRPKTAFTGIPSKLSAPFSSHSLSKEVVQDLTSDLIRELAHKPNPAADAIADWGSMEEPEESDNLSIFRNPISACFSDMPDHLTEDYQSRPTYSTNRFSVSKPQTGRSVTGTHELDDAEVEDLIQEMVIEIAKEGSEDEAQSAFPSIDFLTDDDSGKGGFWRG